MILQCPVCATMVPFEHTLSTLKECSCGAVLKRKDAVLTAQNSLNGVTVRGYHIKPGTTGVFDKKTFQVLGKMGVWFQESFFSYWNIVFNDGAIGYLAEGYGLYSILLPENNSGIKSTDLLTNKVGQVASGTPYQLQKKSSSYYWEVEGELVIQQYSAFFDVYDYASEAGDLITLFEWSDHTIDTYSNTPVPFNALQLKNIQEKNPYGIRLKCPQCSKEVAIRTYPLAQSGVCNSCGTFYAIEKKQLVKEGVNKNNLFEPLLPIGAKGILKEISFEVVGYIQKKDPYNSIWREYVLFNPTYGYAFLSEYDGHWIFVRETLASPVVLNDNTKAFKINGENFQLFNSYSYTVQQARGEFPYNAFDNNNTQAKEYISPPEIWIREKNNKEGITWFFGEHIKGSEIKKAFGISNAMPYRRGIGAVQPTGYMSPLKLLGASVLGILLLLLAHQLFVNTQQNKLITQGNYSFADSSDKIKLVTEKFTLKKWRSNVAFEIYAPVSNSWFELNATLVNVATGKEYSTEQGVEYYFGYSDGEHWTEGKQKETTFITNVPEGTYFLEMEATRENNSFSKLHEFSVKAIYDAESYRNFWFAVLLLLIWPVVNFITNIYTDKSRWENSPYSTYNYE